MNFKKSAGAFQQKLENSRWLLKKNWQLLKLGADLNPKQNRLRETIEQAAREWFAKGQLSNYLLKEEDLILAEQFYISNSDLLSSRAVRYIIESVTVRNKARKIDKAQRNRRLIGISAIATMTYVCLFALSTTTIPTNLLEAENIINPTPNNFKVLSK